MKKWIVILLVFAAALTGTACAEENVLRIAVTDASDAQNWPAEEAFFMENDGTEIEYILYSEDQLYARIQAGTVEADLVILPYSDLVNLEEKGYLSFLDEAAGLTGYPEQMLDLRRFLTKDGRLFALPTSITQEYWFWDESAGEKLGMAWPGWDTWTWEDCIRMAEDFPRDTDGDQAPDLYFMSGTRFYALPAFKNVNVDMFEEYLRTHTDFSLFAEKYLDMLRGFIDHPGLLDMDLQTDEEDCILVGYCGADNPMALMDQTVTNNSGQLLFLPPPVLDRENAAYPGYLRGCAVLKNASSPEKAGAFIRAMVSEDALCSSIFGREDQLMAVSMPVKMIVYGDDDENLPVFTMKDGLSRCRFGEGRVFLMAPFEYSAEAYNRAQAFRSGLAVTSLLYSRDFYTEAYSALQEWYLGHIDDAGLSKRMDYLLGLAGQQ